MPEMQQFKEAGDSKHVYQKKLGKACFQYDIAYGGFLEEQLLTYIT